MSTREERKTGQPGLGAVSLSKCLGGEELRGKQHKWVCGSGPHPFLKVPRLAILPTPLFTALGWPQLMVDASGL